MEPRQHPIEEIMRTTLENLKEMIDVNTIVGDSMTMADGTMIVPVSRMNLGFISGGGEYPGKEKPPKPGEEKLPFAGGAGAGVSISPMAFLVVHGEKVQLMPVTGGTPYDRLAELIPRLLTEIRELLRDQPEENAAPNP